jgi:hypothetical protein
MELVVQAGRKANENRWWGKRVLDDFRSNICSDDLGGGRPRL